MLKEQFPIFISQPDLVYLDSAATALKPMSVVNAICEYYEDYSANVERGLYPIADRATLGVRNAREDIAGFFGANAEQLIFTSGATHGMNLVARSVLMKIASESSEDCRGEVLVSLDEHHSSLLPIVSQGKNYGFDVVLNEDGYESLVDKISERTRLVFVSLASNVVGSKRYLEPIISRAHSVGALVLVDACQAACHMRIDFDDLNADYLVFSGHKLYGPTGVGCLLVSERGWKGLCNVDFGGGAVASVSDNLEVVSKPGFEGFEPGTLPIAQIIGLREAVLFLQNTGIDKVFEHEQNLCAYLVEKLSELDFIEFLGDVNNNVHLLTFNVQGVHAHDVAFMLGGKGICVRAGQHCTQLLHEKMKVPASVRVSFGMFNDFQDCDKLIEALGDVYKMFNS